MLTKISGVKILTKNNYSIEVLDVKDFEKCQNIWDLKNDPKTAQNFYNQIKEGSRKTFIYKNSNGEFVAEISLVFKYPIHELTIKNQRVFLSHLTVKPEFRGKGIGTLLCNYIFDYCKKLNYSEISLEVLINNYHAIRLYHRLGFNKLIAVDEDEDGKYLGLLKNLNQK